MRVMTDTPLDPVPLIRSGNIAKLREELLRWRPQELASMFFAARCSDMGASHQSCREAFPPRVGEGGPLVG